MFRLKRIFAMSRRFKSPPRLAQADPSKRRTKPHSTCEEKLDFLAGLSALRGEHSASGLLASRAAACLILF